MFSKLFAVSAVFSVLVAVSNVARASSSGTSVLQGCHSVEKAADPAAAAVLTSMGVVVHNPNTLVGLTCSPVTDSGELSTEEDSDDSLIDICACIAAPA